MGLPRAYSRGPVTAGGGGGGGFTTAGAGLDASGSTVFVETGGVTLAMLANLAESTFIGRAAGAGTGVPTALSVSQMQTALTGVTLVDGSRPFTGAQQFAAGTAALPGIAIGGTDEGFAHGNDGSNDFLSVSTAGTERARFVGTNLLLGGTSNRVGRLQITGTGAASRSIVGADLDTDATAKSFRVGSLNYTSANDPVTAFVLAAGLSTNVLNLGGGASNMHAATQVSVYTASAVGTATGTETVQITSTLVDLVAGGQLSVRAAGTIAILVGSDTGSSTTRTNATNKVGRMGVPHYTNAEEPLGVMVGTSTGSSGTVAIGGGSSLVNAATTVSVYTAATTTTTTGTETLQITPSVVDLVGGGQLNVRFGTGVGLLIGSDSSSATARTDATSKQARIGAVHYTNSEEPAGLLFCVTSSGANSLRWGGGSGALNAATTHEFYAAANSTTTTGTEIMRLSSVGLRVQNAVSGNASNLVQVFSTTNSNTILACVDSTSSIFTCGATSAAGTTSFAGGPSATSAGTSAFAYGDTAAASGNFSYAIGAACTANATSSVTLGTRSTARATVGKLAMSASGDPIASTVGLQQRGVLCLARQTTDATPTVLASNGSAAGSSNQLILPNNSAYKVTGRVIATVTGAGDTASFTIEACIKRGANAASTALVGTPVVVQDFADAGAVTWTIGVTADTTNGALAITATGASSTTIRWNCMLDSTEVTY